MKIEVANKISLDNVFKEQKLANYQQVDCSIGNDEKIYLLFSEKIPERINGMFVPIESNVSYKALVLTVDWHSCQTCNVELMDFGKIKQNVHFLQPIEDNYLLVGSRTKAKKKNAIIVDKYGNLIKQIYLADGIERCIVDKNNDIITSYFDEGVFGDDPVAASGLVKWSKDGEILWQNSKYDICDCYAMNIDDENNLWFYFYTDFILVKTNYVNDTVYKPNIFGCSNFMLNQSQTALLFDKGYSKYDKFCIKSFNFKNNDLNNSKDAYFTYQNTNILPKYVRLRLSKVILIDKNNNLYYTNWV